MCARTTTRIIAAAVVWITSAVTASSAHAAAVAVSPVAATVSNGRFAAAPTARLTLPAPAAVRISISRGGAPIATLLDGRLRRGAHRVRWNGAGSAGAGVTPGEYTLTVMIRSSSVRRVHRSRIRVAAAAEPVAPSPQPVAEAATMRWPLIGPLLSPFGPRGDREHQGIDIGAPEGTPLRAAASGTVRTAGSVGGFGSTVVLVHGDGSTSLYAHQSKIAVTVGQQVTAGQTIGYVGHTGNTTADHLHFEVRTAAGTLVDPHTVLV